MTVRPLAWLILVAGFAASVAWAADRPGTRRVEQDGISLRVIQRTPEQISAFYAARGFPSGAVQRLARDACFLGVGIRNGRKEIVWLEPSRWRLERDGKRIRRLDRPYWDRVWAKIGLPKASQSTFGWTQLPESRDLRPGEGVGGNITIAPTAGPFRLRARFKLGARRDQGEISIEIDGLDCPGRSGTSGR
ncbi:MAG: hypothetical protein P8X48_02585 [Acidiferrobacteraceae bacterium]